MRFELALWWIVLLMGVVTYCGSGTLGEHNTLDDVSARVSTWHRFDLLHRTRAVEDLAPIDLRRLELRTNLMVKIA